MSGSGALRGSMAVLAACALLAGWGCADRKVVETRPGTLASAPRLDIEEARKLINAYRAERGLKPLSLDARLIKAAEVQSQHLATKDRPPGGSMPMQRVERAGYRPRLAAENVAAGQASLGEVIEGWKKSPAHNRNLLLPDATEMGIALTYDPATRYRAFWALVVAAPR
jgi:uncharacterized protein YkwD